MFGALVSARAAFWLDKEKQRIIEPLQTFAEHGNSTSTKQMRQIYNYDFNTVHVSLSAFQIKNDKEICIN